jgi:tRNA1Val (adenine37-N6)-methyltransferase
MAFRFRKFSVEDELSSMRIGTDAVLLGAWINPENRSDILDIGTGCGVIALMMAQKSNALITAIDIDEDSANQASVNFRNSPWDKRMKALHCSFQEFSKLHNRTFDLVITNPPYFRNSLRSPSRRRNIARHDDQLNAHDLLTGMNGILNSKGGFYIILPTEDAISFREYAKLYNLFLVRQLQVKSKPGRKPKRIALEFSFAPPLNAISEEIIIRREDNSFSKAYLELTKDFYLDFS